MYHVYCNQPPGDNKDVYVSLYLHCFVYSLLLIKAVIYQPPCPLFFIYRPCEEEIGLSDKYFISWTMGACFNHCMSKHKWTNRPDKQRNQRTRRRFGGYLTQRDSPTKHPKNDCSMTSMTHQGIWRQSLLLQHEKKTIHQTPRLDLNWHLPFGIHSCLIVKWNEIGNNNEMTSLQ